MSKCDDFSAAELPSFLRVVRNEMKFLCYLLELLAVFVLPVSIYSLNLVL